MDFKTLTAVNRTRAEPVFTLPRKRVLIVDDLPEICEYLKDVFHQVRGFDLQLTTEIDSRRALDLVSREAFDMVVSDFRMRDVDGIEILSTARRLNPRGLRILITGYNEIPASLDRIRQASVDVYLQKPFDGADLTVLIFSLLKRDRTVLEGARRDARELERMALFHEQRGKTPTAW